jgi:CHAT domain-containing protein
LTRPADKHLDNNELDALVSLRTESFSDSTGISEQSMGEVRRHAESCPECSRIVQKHKSVQMEISGLHSPLAGKPGPDCQPGVDWVRVAAGIMPEPETRILMSHASQCDHCGPALRRAAEFLCDEATQEEERALGELRSKHPVWRNDLISKLGRHGLPKIDAGKGAAIRWKESALWIRVALALASAIAFLLAIGGWRGLTFFRSPTAEQLLAQAYTEQRTLEMRIPGAKYAPMRVELGPGQSHADRPASLLRAEVMIADNLRSRPADARWLHAKGQAELLEGDFDPARKNLQLARKLSPNDEAIGVDLATAAFGIGNSGEALNILRDLTTSNPRNSVAWFNLALTCEKMQLLTESINAWNSFLALDSKSLWADDARAKKRRVEMKVLGRPTSKVFEEPKKVMELARTGGAAFDEKIELYLNIAVSDWLPRAGTSYGTAQDALKAATFVASIAATQHEDHWLREVLLKVGDDSDIREGWSSLAEAVRDSKAGNYSKAKVAAHKAELRFRKHGLTTGVLRARFEKIYADHLSQHGETCFADSGSLLDELHGRSYAWLEIQTSLERAICANMTGQMREAKVTTNSALKLALDHRYRGLHLRATSLASTLEWTTGNLDEATRLATDGLSEFWSGPFPAMAGYNLYAVLDSVAQDSEQWFTQVSTGREALHLLASDPDHSLLAIMHQTLANAALSSGELEIADENFREAIQQLNLALPDQSTRTSQAVTEVGIARMEYLKGEYENASREVQNVEPLLAGTSNRFVLLDFYLTKGDTLTAVGQRNQAEEAFKSAITVCEGGLTTISSERDRLLWTRLYERSYRALVELVLSKNQSKAFSWWEWYRSAPLGGVQRARLKRDFSRVNPNPPLETAQRGLSPLILRDEDTVLLSYIFFKTEAGGWLKSSTATFYSKLPLPSTDIQDLAKRFGEDCANPNSDQMAVHDEARKLFEVLLRPYIESIGSHHKLLIEADGVLDNIAFEALVDDQNRFLGDNYSVSISPGLFYLSQGRPLIRSLGEVESLIVGNPSVNFSDHRVLSPIPRADEEARQIAKILPHSHLLIGREATTSAIFTAIQRADIFHFAGHAVVMKDGSGLVIGGTSRTDMPELLDALHFENMHLRRTKLVVLSACASAGNGAQTLSEVRSLARTLISSGVSQVLASRWSVDSEATTDLMEAFYSRLLRGESVNKALQNAKIEIRKKQGFSHPFYWAGFSVFGST